MITARAYKNASRKGSLKVTFHTPESVGKCEGMNSHTPKWAPTLGVKNLDGLSNLERGILGVKIH
jgi:hypothetical protein